MEEKKISAFYDEYSDKQVKTGVNVRHRMILHRMKEAGLKPNHRVLEIGCGIGTVTSLIADYLRNGHVLGVDISPKSIEVAKQQHRRNGNVDFLVSDMSAFSYHHTFDFVVLPDVLEHIPVEQHKNLFAVIRKSIHADSTVVINLPSPYALDWMRKNKPELLQIIDQSIYTNDLLPNVYAADMYLYSLEHYMLFTQQPDYQWIVLKPNKPYEHLPKSYFEKAILTLRMKLFA